MKADLGEAGLIPLILRRQQQQQSQTAAPIQSVLKTASGFPVPGRLSAEFKMAPAGSSKQQ
jgi:hypothetical protein